MPVKFAFKTFAANITTSYKILYINLLYNTKTNKSILIFLFFIIHLHFISANSCIKENKNIYLKGKEPQFIK